jgi:PST family polysaccharide transporter
LQVGNYIVPLLTLPFLYRVLGPDYVGLISFATATIMYIGLLNDYGFNISATRQVSINSENQNKINEIFSSVMIIKLFLIIPSIIILLLLIIIFEKFKANWEVFIYTFGIVIGQAIFPLFLFQGLEKIKEIVYINLISKMLFLILILTFLKNELDYLMIPIFTTIGSVIAGLWSLNLVLNKMKYKFVWPGCNNIKFHLKDGYHIFISTIAVSIYTISPTFILGIMTNNTVVGQFSAVEKIIQAAKGFYNPVLQAFFPFFSKNLNSNKIEALKLIKNLTYFIIIIMTCICGLIFNYSEIIISLIFGTQFYQAPSILRILSPLPLIIALSNIAGVLIMINLGLKSAFSKILSLSAFIGIILILILIYMYESKGAAFAILFTELFVTVLMLGYVYKYLKKQKIV